jgi:hypothetical protein
MNFAGWMHWPRRGSFAQYGSERRGRMNDRASTRDDTLATNASTTPLRAQLYHKLLTPEELAVLLAMLEIGDSTGQFLFPSVPRIADYAKLSERTAQKVLHGEIRKAPPKPPAVYIGLIERHILVQLAPANATKRRATTYRLQVEALRDDPRTERWRQKKLPFPADDVDLEKWIHHNPGAWSQIKRDLRNAAEARIGTQPLSSAASQAFMVSIARNHGMPHRLARLCVEISRK